MEIVLVITIGVIICVAIICYTSVRSSENNIKIQKLKSIAMGEYQIDHSMNIDKLKEVLHDVYTILYK